MNTHRPAEPPDDAPGKIPAHRKVLRVLRETTKAPNIRGKTISPKRNPEDQRRFRKEADKTAPKQDLNALFSQFVDFMSKAIEQYSEPPDNTKTEEKQRKAEARIYTPCSAGAKVPSIKAERPTYRPEITKGKLYFNCPACFYPTAVFAEYAGRKSRCPRCFSAILTPDPRTGAAGQNLENDIDVLLHPDEFVTPIPKRTSISTMLPLPKINTALSTAAMIVFFAASIGAGHLAVKHYSPNKPIVSKRATNPSVFARLNVSVPALQARAEKLVARFLEEPDWYSRSRLVRDRHRVAPMMKDYYRVTRPNDVPGQHDRIITARKTGFYEHLSASVQYTVVSAQLPGSGAPPSEFIVEHTPNGDYIEWESSVAYNPVPLNDLLLQKEGTVQTVRVLAAQDDYFNYAYNDDQEFICLRIQFPDDPETAAYSYLSARDIEASKLLRHLRGATKDNPRPMMLDVRIANNAASSRQLEIVTVGEDHWRWEGNLDPAFLVDGMLPPSPVE